MDKRMHDLNIQTSEGEIWIKQASGIPGEEDDWVIVAVDQVDALIKWLQEAKDEIQNASK